MTAMYVACLLIVAAAVAAAVWLKHAGDQSWVLHQLKAQRRVHVDLVFDGGPFVSAMRRAADRINLFVGSSLLPLRPCGCPEMAEHTRDCPDHPANRGLRSHLRWRSRRAAATWHRWWRMRAIVAADRHFDRERTGRWFR